MFLDNIIKAIWSPEDNKKKLNKNFLLLCYYVSSN